MDDFIAANPCQFDHASLFETLQHLTLEIRMQDNVASLVRALCERRKASVINSIRVTGIVFCALLSLVCQGLDVEQIVY